MEVSVPLYRLRERRILPQRAAALACAVAAGGVGAVLLGCRDCSGAVRPIPPVLLQAQLALCGAAALLYAAAGASARRRHLAIGLNALAFAGLLVATAHGIVAQEGFCPSCLVVWCGLGAALLVQSLVAQDGASPLIRWWLPAVLAGSLALRGAARGTSDSALLLQDALRRGLTRAGFDYRLPRTVLRPGDAVPGLEAVDGLTVFLTECSPCTRKVLEGVLARQGASPARVTFVVGDEARAWQVPTGYEATRKVGSAPAWKAAGILPFGPPCVVRLERGKVAEVLL